MYHETEASLEVRTRGSLWRICYCSFGIGSLVSSESPQYMICSCRDHSGATLDFSRSRVYDEEEGLGSKRNGLMIRIRNQKMPDHMLLGMPRIHKRPRLVTLPNSTPSRLSRQAHQG
jgi:hypothetical protein